MHEYAQPNEKQVYILSKHRSFNERRMVVETADFKADSVGFETHPK
jgi:hypothetical protein